MTPWRAAALGVFLQAAWLAAVAGDLDVTLALARALDTSAPGDLDGWAMDAAVLLPLSAIAAACTMLARNSAASRSGLPMAVIVLGWLVANTAFLANRDLFLYRFVAVRDGVLYRSGQMSIGALDRTLHEQEIRTLLFLRNHQEDMEREDELARRMGVRFEHVPMGRPANAAKRFVEIMDDPKNHPILIHCHYGVARTGLLTAVYRMEYEGWSNDEALDEARLVSGFDAFDDDSRKREFLLSYNPRRGAPEETEPRGSASAEVPE